MKKADNVEIAPPEKVTLIRGGSFRVKKIASVDVTNIEHVHVIYDKNKIDISRGARTYCHNDMADQKLKKEILQIEAELWYQEARSSDFFKDPTKAQQSIGLRVAIAEKAKELAQIYVSLYLDEKYKQKILSLIYVEYVTYNYSIAIGAIKILLKSRDFDDNIKEKEKLGKWLLYMHGNLLAACIVSKDHKLITNAKVEGKEIDQFLISKGLGHLVAASERPLEEAIKHDAYLPHFTAPLKSMIGSFFTNPKSQEIKLSSFSDDDSLSKVKKGPYTE